MARMVKRLSNLDIDEISLVDRPANQHGLVAIAKRDEESTMSAAPLFDVEGYEVDPSQLEDGQYVYDEDGNEYVNVFDDGDGDDYDEDSEGDEDFGKAAPFVGPLRSGRHDLGRRAARAARQGSDRARMGASAGANSARRGARRANDWTDDKILRGMNYGITASERAGAGARRANAAAANFGQTRLGGARASAASQRLAYNTYQEGGNTLRNRVGSRALGSYGRHPGAYVAGGVGATGTAAGGAEYGRRRRNRDNVGKSYGQQVLEELSKSYSDDDRDSVISKALDQVAAENEFLVSKAEELEEAMLELQEEQEFGEFVELAKSYGYAPGEDEEVAEMLYSVAKNDPDYLPVLDRILTSQAEIAKSYMDEIGYDGVFESDALASVYGLADQVVSKSDGALSHEQAVTELFASNPALYDEYERDNRF